LFSESEEENGGDLDHVGQVVSDLIMWKDASKSTFWFGFCSLCLLSSCFTQGLNFRSVLYAFLFFIFTHVEKKSEFFFIKISVFSRPCRNWGFSYRVFRFSRIRFVKGTIFSSRFIGGVMLQALSCVFCDWSLCFRNEVEEKREIKLTEDDILRLAKLILPALNFAISRMRALFSGEPSMTLKVIL